MSPEAACTQSPEWQDYRCLCESATVSSHPPVKLRPLYSVPLQNLTAVKMSDCNVVIALFHCTTCCSVNCDLCSRVLDSSLRVKTACTRTSNGVCEPQEGAYCVDVTGGGCARAQRHSSCLPGQYISERGGAPAGDFGAQLVVKEESQDLSKKSGKVPKRLDFSRGRSRWQHSWITHWSTGGGSEGGWVSWDGDGCSGAKAG